MPRDPRPLAPVPHGDFQHRRRWEAVRAELGFRYDLGRFREFFPHSVRIESVNLRCPLAVQLQPMAALDVLREAKALGGGVFVFPSPWRGVDSLSDRTCTKMLRHNGIAATVHGFRTSFKTWCMESTETPWAVGEAALAHTLGNSTEQAYARSDLFEQAARSHAAVEQLRGVRADGDKSGRRTGGPGGIQLPGARRFSWALAGGRLFWVWPYLAALEPYLGALRPYLGYHILWTRIAIAQNKVPLVSCKRGLGNWYSQMA